MADIDFLRPFGLCVFPLIALFYLLRLARGRTWIGHVDVESEGGHAVMALGMVCMLVPAPLLTSPLLFWNIVLFAVASLWFTGRLALQRPLLNGVFQAPVRASTWQADAIHMLTNVGMCYMFLLMSNMAFSMFPLILPLTYGFGLSFLLFTLFYGREVLKDAQAMKKDWLQYGANVAHIVMSAGMFWMFLSMIEMTLRMG